MTHEIEPISLEEEYKKTGISTSDVSLLRNWLKTQPHLPENYITDLDLLLAFYCCRRSFEVAKQVLDLHFTLRTHFTNIFSERLVDDTNIKALNVVLAVPLETLSIDLNYRVIYYRLIDYEVKNYDFTNIVKTVLMLVDLMQYEMGSWPGYIAILDMNGVTLGHIGKIDLQTLQQFMYFLQEAMLLRLRQFHFLNAPSFIDKIMMLIRPFLKKEVLNMIGIHSSGSKTIEKIIPIEALPKEAGGKYLTFEEAKNASIERLLANKDYFINENKKRIQESLRPGKAKSITDFFGGIEGSFKKLDID